MNNRSRNWILWVLVLFLVWMVSAASLHAQTFTTLLQFNDTDGAYPSSALVQGVNGSFYGVTTGGGPYDSDGVFFSITSGGTITDLYDFCPDNNCVNGQAPNGIILAEDGNYYGTALGGGNGSGAGTIFKLTPAGVITNLHDFCTNAPVCSDGGLPESTLVQGANGDLYGTAREGGSPKSCPGFSIPGCGTVFKITPQGTFTALHAFKGPDGIDPFAGLVQGTDGNFYGTTVSGGANSNSMCGELGCGTVFKMTPGGALTTLYNFCSQENCADGAEPASAMIQGTDGNFYGTTSIGGLASTDCGYGVTCGTVFKITPGGSLTVIYEFCALSGCADGSGPAGIIQGTDGNFYGVTEIGGAYDNQNNCGPGMFGCGTIFSLTPSGTLTTLHSFDSTADGQTPTATLLQATNGTFYGSTSVFNGGCCGTIFSVNVGLGPFVQFKPAEGKVGSKVGILGTDLTGAISVTFNGKEAAFRVVSSTFIEAKVPTGATSGTIQVQLPGGALSSNVPFIVLP